MSEHAQSTSQVASAASPTAPTATDATTAAGAVSSNTNLAETPSTTTFGTMAQLKEKAPDIYRFMMLSLAQNMCIQMNRKNERLIQEMRKMREKSS